MPTVPQTFIGLDLGLGGGEGVEEFFDATAVNFDGTNDFLEREGGLTGAANSKQLILSWWFRLNGNDAGAQRFATNTSNKITLFRETAAGGNRLAFQFQQEGGATVWAGSSTTTFTVANSEWVHVLLGLDSAPGGNRKLYINDVLETIAGEGFNADTIVDMTVLDWSLGAALGGTLKMTADMAEFYFTDEFLDFTIESNRRKFIDAAGKPVDLGSDGSLPTGTAPLVFFSGETANWHTNKGSGGGYTENGALTDAADSPSD